MLQSAGAIQVNTPIKSISAIKPSRGSGQTRAKKKINHTIRWKRFTASIDEAMREAKKLPPDKIDQAVAMMAANARLTAPISRLAYYGHITVTQAMAGRRYAGIVREFERYHVANATRSARAQDIDKPRAGEDQEIQRRIQNGTIADYEAAAKKARKEYDRMQKVLARYGDPVTGRNEAKNILDDLCLSDIEPPTQYRQNIAAVLQALANEFGVKERR
jgi:short subunit dehydrogenase-like uncharacterized protein